jgi:hypothetical protein
MNVTTSPACHEESSVSPIDVVPYDFTAMAPLPLTFNVGEAAVFAFAKRTEIIVPSDNENTSLLTSMVSTFELVLASVEHVP